MTVLNKSEVRTPTLARETVEVNVPDMPGDVVVQALPLTKRLELALGNRGLESISVLLAHSVVDNVGAAFGDVAWWEAFGSKEENSMAVLKLWDAARRLSGMDGVAQKNEQAPS